MDLRGWVWGGHGHGILQSQLVYGVYGVLSSGVFATNALERVENAFLPDARPTSRYI